MCATLQLLAAKVQQISDIRKWKVQILRFLIERNIFYTIKFKNRFPILKMPIDKIRFCIIFV